LLVYSLSQVVHDSRRHHRWPQRLHHRRL